VGKFGVTGVAAKIGRQTNKRGRNLPLDKTIRKKTRTGRGLAVGTHLTHTPVFLFEAAQFAFKRRAAARTGDAFGARQLIELPLQSVGPIPLRRPKNI
jgi:hypothetical protein